jgi:hypothetical protein
MRSGTSNRMAKVRSAALLTKIQLGSQNTNQSSRMHDFVNRKEAVGRALCHIDSLDCRQTPFCYFTILNGGREIA